MLNGGSKCFLCGRENDTCECSVSNIEINGKLIDCRLSELSESDRRAIESIMHNYSGSVPNGDGTHTHTFGGEPEGPNIGIKFDDDNGTLEFTALTEDGKEIIRRMKKEALIKEWTDLLGQAFEITEEWEEKIELAATYATLPDEQMTAQDRLDMISFIEDFQNEVNAAIEASIKEAEELATGKNLLAFEGMLALQSGKEPTPEQAIAIMKELAETMKRAGISFEKLAREIGMLQPCINLSADGIAIGKPKQRHQWNKRSRQRMHSGGQMMNRKPIRREMHK